ncbi:MAG: hypothetical protein LUG23_09330 [Oscillospiraceae bacterium]|nr:hypothetical protein [Oscillospiraceae bacterium]
MANSRKYKVKHSSKPMFKQKRKKGNSVLGIIFMIILLAALVFVGYSVGKPIVEFLSGERDTPANSGTESSSDTSETTENTTTAATSATTEATTEEPEPTVAVTNNIYYISYSSDIADYESYVYSAVEYASENGYSGVCVELIAEGGAVTYSSANTTAIEAGAVVTGGISDLSALVSTITDSGLTAYARISTLSDNIASTYDKTLAYMITGTDTRWYDDNTANGGKPWISPYSSTATEYIESLVSEISDAGFVGLVAGEIEFPPFRSSDIRNYFSGTDVASSTRYQTLISLAETVYNSFGSAKEFYIEVDAEDIISGDAEILTDPDSLCTSVIYVNFNPDSIGTRISRADGTEVSFEGLNTAYLFRTVFNLVEESLEGTGVTVIPKITGCKITGDLLSAIELMGYDMAMIEE